VGRLAAAEELVEDVGAEGVGDEGGAERVLGIFLLGFHEFGFDDALGAEFFVVLASDIQQVALVLSGMMRARAPCLKALKEDEALPSAERGPVGFWALRRLAWI